MGLESRQEQPKDPLIVAQVALAQLAFESEDRRAAMAHWLAGGDSSLAAHFREYVEAHPGEPIDAQDKAALQTLLEKIRTYH